MATHLKGKMVREDLFAPGGFFAHDPDRVVVKVELVTVRVEEVVVGPDWVTVGTDAIPVGIQ
jgi:hypothetical protein